MIMFKRGDWVKVIKRSKHFNPHINNVGYVGIIDDLHEKAVQIECTNGGMGAVDIDCVEHYEPSLEDKASMGRWGK